jgi:2-polyprenyl-6-methoxyphenol hydroxylase-like FAD-dependent oxidoreductase
MCLETGRSASAGCRDDESIPDIRREQELDVAIVGAGLGGSAAAVALGRAGYRVGLIDRYAHYPPEFRVEKLAGDQLDWLHRLGLMDSIAAASTRFEEILNIRRGKVIDVTRNSHYGILYQDLVNAVRDQLDAPARLVLGKAIRVQTSPDRQRVELSDGSEVIARLVIAATGMAPGISHSVGVTRKVLSPKHSITFGFDLSLGAGAALELPACTYYGETASDRIDYLNIFPVGSRMRANLFTFRDARDPWLRQLREAPETTLTGALPGLRPFLGDFRVHGRVQSWSMDLYALEGYLRPGLVFVGDAFQTSCPAAGTGVSRLLAEVHQLCMVHVPSWLATPGMEVAKISAFYADPVKRRSDRRASRLSSYRRSLTLDTSWAWEMHRGHTFLRRRLVGWVRRLKHSHSNHAIAFPGRSMPADDAGAASPASTAPTIEALRAGQEASGVCGGM